MRTIRLGFVLTAWGAILLALSGCNIAGWLGYVAMGDQVPPVYKPEKDKTALILVDQAAGPGGLALGDRDKSGVVASSIALQLREGGAISKIVDPAALAALRQKAGDDFDQMPAVEIARQLGAQQAIQVYVQSISLQGQYDELGSVRLYRPVAEVRVRTFDVKTGNILFPAPELNDVSHVVRPNGEEQSSFEFTVALTHKAAPDDRRDPLPAMRQELAERIGRDVGRLFTGYDKAQPGERREQGPDMTGAQ